MKSGDGCEETEMEMVGSVSDVYLMTPGQLVFFAVRYLEERGLDS